MGGMGKEGQGQPPKAKACPQNYFPGAGAEPNHIFMSFVIACDIFCTVIQCCWITKMYQKHGRSVSVFILQQVSLIYRHSHN